jgi:hypothetical protein
MMPPVQPPPPVQILRFGGSTNFSIGLPTGSMYSGSSLGDSVSSMFQLEGSADLIVMERVILGFNLGLGYLPSGDEFEAGCRADGGSCFALNINFGAHAEALLLPPHSPFVPWVGLEAGIEDLLLSESVGSQSSTASFAGNQYEIRAGLDLSVRGAQRGWWGPFIAYRYGKYTAGGLSNDTTDTSFDIANPASHGFLFVGLRGRY